MARNRAQFSNHQFQKLLPGTISYPAVLRRCSRDILIAHAGKGSKTESLCRDLLAQGKPVFTLDSPDNAHLIEFGATPVLADDPRPFLTEAADHAG